MQKFSCIIVEDEPLAAEVLEDYIRQVPFLELKKTCSDAIFAMEELQEEKIDVIFLDIHLPKLKGVDFIKALNKGPQIIITTAYSEYALQGYELNVTDYLLKPIEFNRFLMAVNKLKPQNWNGKENVVASSVDLNEKPHLFLTVNKKKVKVYTDDILYIESRKEYVNIITKDKSIIAKFQLSHMEELLPKGKFIRTHRSFIVAKEMIEAYTATDVEVKNKKIPIGRSYKELVMNLLGTTN